MKAYDIVIATGGTGGHIFPALSAGEYFEKEGKKVFYILAGSKIGKIDKTNVIYMNSCAFEKNPKTFIRALYYLFANTIKSFLFFVKNRPCAILATGSYAVVPTLISAIILRIPFFLMEQNVLPGLVNKLFSRFAKSTFIAFEKSKEYLKGTTILTGLPLRKEATQRLEKNESRRLINLPVDKKIILVVGGSLGAKGLVDKILPQAARFQNYQFVIQTGGKNFEYAQNQIKENNIQNVILLPFIQEMGLYYSAADLVISRAGANSCMEIAYHQKPSILVPYPYSRDKHQYVNAELLEKSGLAKVIDEKELDSILPELLANLSWSENVEVKEKIYIEEPEKKMLKEIENHAGC